MARKPLLTKNQKINRDMENFTGELIQEIEDGKLIINYKLGKKNGPTRVVNKKGILVSETNYKDDEIHGPLKLYHNNGSPLSIINYEFGLQNGESLSFFENGVKQTESSYKYGKLDGKFIIYDEFGDKIGECFYVNGDKNGKNFVYYPKAQGGGVFELSVYEKGSLTGNKISFYPSGEVMSITPYTNGKAQTYPKNYDKKGNVIS